MNLLDYTWSTVEFITNKSPNAIKVLLSDQPEYPFIERDSVGPVIHLSSPRSAESDENFMQLYGIHFDNDSLGRTALWRMYRASVCHLSLHAFASDFDIYREWISKENYNNATFAASLSEDYALRAVMRILWPGLLLETALANELNYQCMREPGREFDLATRVGANLLSYSLVGKKITPTTPKIDEQVAQIHSHLVAYSQKLHDVLGSNASHKIKVQDFDASSEAARELRMRAADEVLSVFKLNNLRLSSIPALPYSEHYGKTTSLLFGDPAEQAESETSALEASLQELSIRGDEERLLETESALKAEAETILGEWEYEQSIKKRLVDIYGRPEESTATKNSSSTRHHFEYVGYPAEDFAEFTRIKTRLIGRIRCALDILRMAKTSILELTALEYGYVDVPLAIQVIASKSNSTDVFFRDEQVEKSESWAILIDSSKSLERLVSSVKDATVCLSEIANGMLKGPESWACYTFNENFYIIKDYAERYDNDVKARIGGITPGLKTYLPDAIRIAATRLQHAQSDLKVIVVVSDGYPLGYEGIDRELVRAVESVSKQGIQLIGIGVESRAISKFFRTTLVARDAYDLMKDFVNVYYDVVRSSI